jgi:hypothetical protein
VVPLSLPTVTAVERAQRELRQLQRANNPHIVKVVDFGKAADGRLFVASELVDGEPLDQVITRLGPMTLDRAKRIVGQIGEALLEAQKVGVVHRDLAAKNVLVSGDDEVRIINFSIPRPLFENLFGVPEFMSPEQAEGKLIDQRSNTYSLGALLYLMLTGYSPHTGDTPQAVVEAVRKGDITPPSIRRGGGLTAEVDRIVLKALERNSSRRPLTLRQFLTDVSGLIVTEQQATPTSAGAGAAGRDAGFARTMMFAGGASEVQKLVAQAVAAREAAGNGTAEAVPATQSAVRPPTPSPSRVGRPLPATPPPAVPMAVSAERTGEEASSSGARPFQGAAIGATMVALPSSNAAAGLGGLPDSDGGGTGAGPATPSPGAPAVVPPAARGTGRTPAPEAGANFRETLWFKKGDVDQMVADARAKMAVIASAKKVAAESEVPTEDAKPLEERYVDDGTVTVEDRQKFSLGSGGTATATPARGGSVPGERMSEDEILDEIGGGKRFVIIGIVAAVALVLVAVVAVSMRGKGSDKPPQSPASVPAAVTAPENPVPSPVAPPPEKAPILTPPVPAQNAESAGAEPEPGAEEKAESPSKPASSKKHTAQKKKAAPAAKKRR